jgi:MoaA/NifB/PqqE/SkfB family radical SAM enzyme
MFNNESFCPELWSQIEIGAGGDYKICCLANYDSDFGMAVDENNDVMNVLTHSFEEAINSVTHKKHRLELKENIKPKRCRNCYDSEDSTKGLLEWGNSIDTGRSKRQRVIRLTAPSIPEYVTYDKADRYTLDDGTATSKVVNLHLRFGNLCNMKCIMCSPQHSNLWYDDWLDINYYGGQQIYKFGKFKTYNLERDEHGRVTMDIPKWYETEIWWNRVKEIAPRLKYIYFTGGEPFLVPAMHEMLDYLIDNNFATDVQLRFDTNLSVINPKLIAKLKKFKKILMCVSIDDVGEQYELIRFPGKFNNFTENIKTLQKSGIEIHYISTCVGIGSIYSMMRVNKFAKTLNVPTEYRFLEGPSWLDLRHLPKSAKLEIIEKYKCAGEDDADHKWFKAMINLLTKYLDEFDISKLHEFVRVMDILDEIRSTNWRVTLTDVHDLLKRHCPELKL